mmetsp:Transcript_26829/g.66801  ORF Transcript_26829/g.66801 Transcript_26829/m.66801 type:complete len:238 (-) Transcript_26829:41-754(-)
MAAAGSGMWLRGAHAAAAWGQRLAVPLCRRVVVWRVGDGRVDGGVDEGVVPGGGGQPVLLVVVVDVVYVAQPRENRRLLAAGRRAADELQRLHQIDEVCRSFHARELSEVLYGQKAELIKVLQPRIPVHQPPPCPVHSAAQCVPLLPQVKELVRVPVTTILFDELLEYFECVEGLLAGVLDVYGVECVGALEVLGQRQHVQVVVGRDEQRQQRHTCGQIQHRRPLHSVWWDMMGTQR